MLKAVNLQRSEKQQIFLTANRSSCNVWLIVSMLWETKHLYHSSNRQRSIRVLCDRSQMDLAQTGTIAVI